MAEGYAIVTTTLTIGTDEVWDKTYVEGVFRTKEAARSAYKQIVHPQMLYLNFKYVGAERSLDSETIGLYNYIKERGVIEERASVKIQKCFIISLFNK